MGNPNNQEIVYSLNIEDVQTVALQELERRLSIVEIELVRDSIAKNINWYDVIADSISQNIEIQGLP